MSIERLLAEIRSWRVVSEQRAAEIVTGTLDGFSAALSTVRAPKGVSAGLVEHLHWTIARLMAGAEISEPKR
jgi:hypothetical protein